MSKIRFVSTVQGLNDIEWAKPKPAKAFVPTWFKNIPSNLKSTIKDCPAMPDYFSQGYVVPMWMDSELSENKEENVFSTTSSDYLPKWEHHPRGQFLDHVDSSHFGASTDFTFKAICPWLVFTEPGWSVLQLPIFYNFNKEWTVLPGVIDTDIHHEINQQVLYHGTGKNTLISAGEPFALYIPFKRQKTKLETSDIKEKDIKKYKTYPLEYRIKNSPNGVYRKKQRERDMPKKGFLENLRDRLEE